MTAYDLMRRLSRVEKDIEKHLGDELERAFDEVSHSVRLPWRSHWSACYLPFWPVRHRSWRKQAYRRSYLSMVLGLDLKCWMVERQKYRPLRGCAQQLG